MKKIEQQELLQDDHIRKDIEATLYFNLDIIQAYWDSFCERRVSHLMIDFEFNIDMGDPLPLCCRQLIYRFDEDKITIAYIIDF